MNDDQGDGQVNKALDSDAPVTEATGDSKPETPDTEQSNEVKKEDDVRTYEDSFGNKLTADELYETYQKIIPNYTRVTQELADLRKASEVSSKQAEDSIRENKLLENVPPDVKEAIVSIVKPLIQEENQKKEEQRAQEEKNKAFEDELKKLETELDGKDGRPKFDREKVIAKMMEKGNRVYDPRAQYYLMHQKELADWTIKQALKQQRGGRNAEETSGQEPKLDSKTPTTFQEASQALLSRLRSDQ